MNIVERHINEIAALCKKHNVNTLYIFGSFAKGNATDKSDIDLLVTFGDVDLYNYFDNYYDFLKGMEHLFEKKVDLVSEKYVRNPYLKKSIDSSKVLLYDRQHPNMAA